MEAKTIEYSILKDIVKEKMETIFIVWHYYVNNKSYHCIYYP